MKTKNAKTFKIGFSLLALGGLMVFANNLRDDRSPFRESLKIEHEDPDRTGPLGGYAVVVDKVAPCVVSIYTEKKLTARNPQSVRPFFDDPMFRRFFGDQFEFFSTPRDGEQQPGIPREIPRQNGLGSGVILTTDGYLVTNNHVIDGADEIKVRFPDQKRDYPAKVVGRDASTDLAILKVEASGLQAATLGDSARLKVGDTVLAIGNPFGLSQTVTSGIVSALGRKNLNIASYENFIQTDASINPGNSGGALVDNQGRVIGINTAIMPRAGGGNIGIGFAIPVNLAVEVAERLIEDGEIQRGYLGVMLSDLTADLAEAFETKVQGALVNEVLPDTPAERAGLRPGDIVIRYDDTAVEDMAQLRFLVAGTDPGRKVGVTVLRDGKEEKLTIQLGNLSDGEVAREDGSESGSGSEFLSGVQIRDLNDELRQRYGLADAREGALVVSVDPNSRAARAGLRTGHLILEVAKEPVGSAQEATRVLKRVRPTTEVVLLRVKTPDGSRFLAVELEKTTD